MINFNLFDNLTRFSNKVALVTDSFDYIKYRELLEISIGFSSKVPKRTVVIIVCDNSVGSVASYVGFIRTGIVPILLERNIGYESIKNISRAYNVKYICSENSYLDKYNEKFHIIHSHEKYDLIEFIDIDCINDLHNDLALLLPTSGSTGSPKLVKISYKNLYSNTKSISQSLPIESNDVALTTMPMSYSYGLSIVNTHLFNGASIVLTNKTMMEKGFWSLFFNTKITTFGGVPFIYKMLKRLKFSEMNINTLKYITQAGGRLEPSLVEYFTSVCKKNNSKFYVMYGQTEATARMSVLSFKNIDDKKDSIGKAIPGGKFMLIDGKGREVTKDKTGELIYFGDNVSMGYANNYADLVLGDINKGKLKTGDIARRDSDGYYYIIGRRKRFVKIFGVRVGLDEVENYLNDKGLECVCSGSDDNLKIYTTNPDYIDKIRDFISERKLIHHKGYSVHLIDYIPRNKSGKVKYSCL